MTKAELEKEAEKYADTVKCEWENDTYWVDCRDEVTDAYLAGAEPREKRIAELEAQIEKMKCCENCRHREPYCEEAIRLPFGCCCEKWELRR